MHAASLLLILALAACSKSDPPPPTTAAPTASTKPAVPAACQEVLKIMQEGLTGIAEAPISPAHPMGDHSGATSPTFLQLNAISAEEPMFSAKVTALAIAFRKVGEASREINDISRMSKVREPTEQTLKDLNAAGDAIEHALKTLGKRANDVRDACGVPPVPMGSAAP